MHYFVIPFLFLLAFETCLITGHPNQESNYGKLDAAGLLRSPRALNSCIKSRAVREAPERRETWANSIRSKRDLATALATSHHSNAHLTSRSNPFTGNATCLLYPEGILGPYWVKGEYIRQDIRERQPGVDLYLDIQVIDVNTCKPVPNVYVDIWSCNSTGVYSGISDGNRDDRRNLNATFLRGLQPTGTDGVSKFTTIFPGHYADRAVHIHVMVHRNGTVLPNNTYTSGTVPHVGRLYFDQNLINTVETTTPYNTNTIPLTTNAEDSDVEMDTSSAADPFLSYVLLGNKITDGLLGWITLGVDLSADQSSHARAAATLTADGGILSPGGFGGPCGFGPGGPRDGFNGTQGGPPWGNGPRGEKPGKFRPGRGRKMGNSGMGPGMGPGGMPPNCP